MALASKCESLWCFGCFFSFFVLCSCREATCVSESSSLYTSFGTTKDSFSFLCKAAYWDSDWGMGAKKNDYNTLGIFYYVVAQIQISFQGNWLHCHSYLLKLIFFNKIAFTTNTSGLVDRESIEIMIYIQQPGTALES